MRRAALKSVAALGLVAVTAAASPLHEAAHAGPAVAAPSLPEPVQYRERSRSGGSQSLFEGPTLRQPGSLFPPHSGRIGPHYEPPPVVYEPPPVTYRPPSAADRAGGSRCAWRTRAWYGYCAARYRSFDPDRGTYMAHSGQERPCRCP